MWCAFSQFVVQLRERSGRERERERERERVFTPIYSLIYKGRKKSFKK